MKDPWYESDNPDRVARALGGRAILWIIVFVVVFGLIGVALWAFGVFTSDIKGRGDAIKTKNSGTNRIAAQERFETMYQDIVAADKRVDVMAEALRMDKKSQVAQTNYLGAVTYCQQVVADYNAEARKFTAADFRAADLPARIDDLDSTTDCKRSNQ